MDATTWEVLVASKGQEIEQVGGSFTTREAAVAKATSLRNANPKAVAQYYVCGIDDQGDVVSTFKLGAK